MARKALYDLDEIIPLAIELFWQSGYDGTSMDELINYTGFNRRSMYAEFGNKQKFFHASLKLYIEQHLSPILEILHSDQGQEAIEFFFFRYNRFVINRGCLLTNAITELASKDEEVKSIAADFFQQLKKSFETCLQKATAQGQVKANIQIESVSVQLLALVQGLAVMSKVCEGRSELDIAVETVLKPLRAQH